MCYEYFSRDPSTWGIIDFLNQCDLEPFERKIDHYIKSLAEIVTSDQVSRRESAQRLLDSYKAGSEILFYLVSEAKKWRDWWPAWTPAIQGCSPSHKTGAGAQIAACYLVPKA